MDKRDTKQLAKEILEKAGGKSNIKTMMNCATRLRFTLADDNRFDAAGIKNIDGVKGTAIAGNQYQVIIGPSVYNVYAELLKMIDSTTGTGIIDVVEKEDLKKKWSLSGLLDVISGIFTPILPAITGAAMIKVLLIILTMSGLLSKDTQTYQILNFVGDTPFYFLPIMLAYTASVKFKLNPLVGMVLGLMLIHPTYVKFVTAGEPVSFLGLPVTLATYTATVIPVILVIWIASYVEQFAEKVSPEAVKFFLKPLIVMLVMVPIAFVAVGPLGTIVGTWLGAGLNVVQTQAPWALPIIFGVMSPIVIMFGMHYVVTIPLVIAALQVNGFDMIGPGFLVANMAQGGAAIALGILAKKVQLKALANSSGLTAVLGISEPAIYGINLRFKKPFLGAMIGGGIGGILAGIAGVKRIVFGPTGLTTIAIFIDPKNNMNFIFAIVAVVASFTIAFLATMLLVKNDKKLMSEIS